ncbi:MAG TPA: hypothetical protein VMT34_16635, partial [Aggregatilineales bacterium]|nr:hypothetical protein [Aggregatilineales bacterium]
MQSELQTASRPDMDIEEDITVSLRNFAPLRTARGFLSYQSTNGHVKISGNVGSPQSKIVLLDFVQKIPGVIDSDMNDLHDDEEIRLNVGQLVPPGVLVSVQFGTVILSGSLPNDIAELL